MRVSNLYLELIFMIDTVTTDFIDAEVYYLIFINVTCMFFVKFSQELIL